jgi:hypothetical protein
LKGKTISFTLLLLIPAKLLQKEIAPLSHGHYKRSFVNLVNAVETNGNGSLHSIFSSAIITINRTHLLVIAKIYARRFPVSLLALMVAVHAQLTA